MPSAPPRLNALLFTPGTRLDRLPKAVACGADGVIVDCEDAVPVADKDRVRTEVIAYFRQHGRIAADHPLVSAIRINNLRSPHGLADLDALNGAAIRPDVVMIAKVESAAEVQLAARKLPESIRLVCLIETVLGVRFVNEIAAASPRVVALAFGGFDLSAETGGDPTWDALLMPRTAVVHACAAAGLLALDQPFIDFANEAGLAEECNRVRQLGFTGKLAIHPAQAVVIRRSFQPDEGQVARARKIVEAFKAARGNVVSVDGQMIDVPLHRSALRLLQRAGE